MRIGAHVSTSESADLAIDRALDIGAEAMQIFVSPPQRWGFKRIDEKVAADFKTKSFDNDMGPTVIHGIYLVSLGSDDEQLVARGKRSLIDYMNACTDLNAMGVIFHLGSHKGRGFEAVLPQVAEKIREVLAESPEDALLILENSAGMGNHIGSKLSELGTMMREIDDPRVKICLDTQHSFAAGYDLRTPEAVEGVMAEFEAEIGLQHLVAVHCNDSKPPFGGALDRHENIGEGEMGLGAFEAIVAHPAFRDVPFYLEVPGYDKSGPDARNVQTMKEIRDKHAIQA
jgi:deoxyribonuclease-4